MSTNEDEDAPLLESDPGKFEMLGVGRVHRRRGNAKVASRLVERLKHSQNGFIERLKRTPYSPLKSLAGAGMGLVITMVGGLSIAANIFPSGTSLYYPEVSPLQNCSNFHTSETEMVRIGHSVPGPAVRGVPKDRHYQSMPDG